MCTPVLGWRGGRPVQRSGTESGSRSLTEIVGRVPSGPRNPGFRERGGQSRRSLATRPQRADPAEDPVPETPHEPPPDEETEQGPAPVQRSGWSPFAATAEVEPSEAATSP